jgi:hypothetical protein
VLSTLPREGEETAPGIDIEDDDSDFAAWVSDEEELDSGAEAAE